MYLAGTSVYIATGGNNAAKFGNGMTVYGNIMPSSGDTYSLGDTSAS